MSSAAVQTAVEARLTANWTTLPLVPSTNVNPAARPAAGFVTIDYLPARETPISLRAVGGIRYREEGRISFTVWVPVSVNADADAQTYADQIRAIFRGRHFGGVRIYGVEGPANHSDGRFYAAAFAMGYRFDNFG